MDSINKLEEKDELLEKVDYIDCQLDAENIKLNKMSVAHEHLLKLKENLNSCSEILSNALEKGTTKQKFDNLIDENNLNFSKAHNKFEEQECVLRQKLNDLRSERENIIREYEEYSGEKET